MDATLERPVPPPVPEGLTPAEENAFLQQHGEAFNLQHRTAGAYAYGSAAFTVANNSSPGAFDLLVKSVLDEAGSPGDPLERMLIEQVVIAHHAIGRLHMQAAAADTVEQAEVFNTAAVRLLGELRRCILAIKTYREPMTPKNVTVVQQNVATEKIAYIEGQQQGIQTSNGDTKQGTKELGYAPPPRPFFADQSSTSRGRQKEPAKTRPANGRGTRAASAGGVGASAMAAVNGTADG